MLRALLSLHRIYTDEAWAEDPVHCLVMIRDGRFLKDVPKDGRWLWECIGSDGETDFVKQQRNTDLLSREYKHPWTEVLTYNCSYGGMFKEPVADSYSCNAVASSSLNTAALQVFDKDGEQVHCEWSPDGLKWATGGFVEGLTEGNFARDASAALFRYRTNQTRSCSLNQTRLCLLSMCYCLLSGTSLLNSQTYFRRLHRLMARLTNGRHSSRWRYSYLE
jgi:hypothetical protein